MSSHIQKKIKHPQTGKFIKVDSEIKELIKHLNEHYTCNAHTKHIAFAVNCCRLADLWTSRVQHLVQRGIKILDVCLLHHVFLFRKRSGCEEDQNKPDIPNRSKTQRVC